MCVVQQVSWIVNVMVLSASRWSTTMEKAKRGVWTMGGEDRIQRPFEQGNKRTKDDHSAR